MDIELLKEYALKFVGTFYHFGGKTPLDGIDCSGFVNEILKAAGITPWNSTLNAQQIHDTLANRSFALTKPQLGAIAFYGHDERNISHVVFCLDGLVALGADGGTAATIDLKSAIQNQAFVKIRPVMYRGDLVAVLMPNY